MVIPTIYNECIVYKAIPSEYKNAATTFESVNTTFPKQVNKVTTPKTYVRKLHGVEKGLYRLNFNKEAQRRFLQAIYNYQDFLRGV